MRPVAKVFLPPGGTHQNARRFCVEKISGCGREEDRPVTRWKKCLRLLGRLLGAAAVLGVLAGLYFTLVIAQPQAEDAEKEEAPQARVSPSPAQRITAEEELRELVSAFPAPVMSFMSGSGMTFVSGTSADQAWRGQFARVLTLYWQTRNGEPLILQSIYPAEALEIMGKGTYAFSETAGPTLFGLPSVRMENPETLRLHVQAEGKGLYVLVVPRKLASELMEISRSIQLFTAAVGAVPPRRQAGLSAAPDKLALRGL